MLFYKSKKMYTNTTTPHVTSDLTDMFTIVALTIAVTGAFIVMRGAFEYFKR